MSANAFASASQFLDWAFAIDTGYPQQIVTANAAIDISFLLPDINIPSAPTAPYNIFYGTAHWAMP